MPSAAATSAASTVVVTKTELSDIAEWGKKLAEAKKKTAAAEREVKFRLLAIAEKTLGVKTEEDLKALTPEQVQRRFLKRHEAGDWRAERGAPNFGFKKTNEGRYPAWGQLFAQEMGETAAARIKTETPLSYSYAVEVEVSLP